MIQVLLVPFPGGQNLVALLHIRGLTGLFAYADLADYLRATELLGVIINDY
jgi:hypothetical protein